MESRLRPRTSLRAKIRLKRDNSVAVVETFGVPLLILFTICRELRKLG
jgi:hypothetical protein